MIAIKTHYHTWTYHGRILITMTDEVLAIESHCDKNPHKLDDKELDMWSAHVYDSFWTKDVISVKGCDDAKNI